MSLISHRHYHGCFAAPTIIHCATSVDHAVDSLFYSYLADKPLVSVSIKVSDTYVSTFYMGKEVFEEIIHGASLKDGKRIENYFIIEKKNFYRFTTLSQ